MLSYPKCVINFEGFLFLFEGKRVWITQLMKIKSTEFAKTDDPTLKQMEEELNEELKRRSEKTVEIKVNCT